MTTVKLIERDDVRLSVPSWRAARFRELLELSGFSMQEMAVFMDCTYGYVRHFASESNVNITADALRLLAYDLAYARGEIK